MFKIKFSAIIRYAQKFKFFVSQNLCKKFLRAVIGPVETLKPYLMGLNIVIRLLNLKNCAFTCPTLFCLYNLNDESALDEFPTFPTIHDMDAPPTISEMETAIAGLKCGKAASPDGIPAELYRRGGRSLSVAVLNYCLDCWEDGYIASQWKRAKMISIYKRKRRKI